LNSVFFSNKSGLIVPCERTIRPHSFTIGKVSLQLKSKPHLSHPILVGRSSSVLQQLFINIQP